MSLGKGLVGVARDAFSSLSSILSKRFLRRL